VTGNRSLVFCAAALLAYAAPARAQFRPAALSVGARVLGALPVGARGKGLKAGRGFGVDVGLEVRPGWTVYAGFSRTGFPLRETDGDRRVDSGADLGIMASGALGGVPLWSRYGLVFHEAETHLASGHGDGLDDGRSGLGLETGVGVTLRLGRHTALAPGVAYTAYPLGETGGISHLRAEVGARLRP